MSIHDDSESSGEKLEKDLHDEKISALYRQLPDAQPAADTDALLRAAARRAVTAGPRKTVFTAKTQGLLATAATLVLGVALLVQWQGEPEQLHEVLATAPASAPAPAAAQDARAENPPLKQAPAAAHRSAAAAAAAMLDDASPKTAIPTGNMAAAPRAKSTPEPAREFVQEPTLAGASSGMLNAQPAASADRSEAEYRAYQAEKYRAEREDDARKAKENSSLHMKNEAATHAAKPAVSAPAPAPAAIAAPAPEPLKKQLAADRTFEEMKADSTVMKLLPYQTAMQAGNWALAQKSMPAPAQSDPVSLQIDRDLVAQLQSSGVRPACAALPEAAIGRESLLCHFLIQHGEGRALPIDIVQQLEKAGLITGIFEYRRVAVKALIKNQENFLDREKP